MQDTRIPLAQLGGADWARRFHVWELDWDADAMVVEVDGRQVNAFDLAQTRNAGNGDNPFHRSMYLLINLALGQHGEPIPERNLPGRLEVDYVRVYQRPGED
jgi:beta-glucanase (GH16 family)